MMTGEDLKKRALQLFAKGRNIIYYKSIDDRPRAQYMHVLRNYRKEIKEFLEEKGASNLFLFNTLKGILNMIPSKIKTEECDKIIEMLNNKIYNNVVQ